MNGNNRLWIIRHSTQRTVEVGNTVPPIVLVSEVWQDPAGVETHMAVEGKTWLVRDGNDGADVLYALCLKKSKKCLIKLLSHMVSPGCFLHIDGAFYSPVVSCPFMKGMSIGISKNLVLRLGNQIGESSGKTADSFLKYFHRWELSLEGYGGMLHIGTINLQQGRCILRRGEP